MAERVGARLAAFGVALALVFGAGFGIGRAVGPWDRGGPAPAPDHGGMEMDHGAGGNP